MKKDKTENSMSEGVEKAEEQKKKPFFFPNEDRTIMAHSMSEARRILETEKGAVASEE